MDHAAEDFSWMANVRRLAVPWAGAGDKGGCPTVCLRDEWGSGSSAASRFGALWSEAGAEWPSQGQLCGQNKFIEWL